MNQSTTPDPFRHLKRIRTRTPSKASLAQSQTNALNSSISISRVQVESRLEETALLKENCYDPNKYYSSKCQQYLEQVNYRSSSPEFRKKESKGERENEEEQDEGKSVESFEARTASVYSYRGNGRAKTGESEGTNKETYFSKHKPEGRGNEEIQMLTFKKLQFEEQPDSSQGKRTTQIPRQLEFDIVDPFTVTTQNPLSTAEAEVASELLPCSICGRSFNPTSYEKHSKICEKVFMKKRKTFSSEKQRSRSKESKR